MYDCATGGDLAPSPSQGIHRIAKGVGLEMIELLWLVAWLLVAWLLGWLVGWLVSCVGLA